MKISSKGRYAVRVMADIATQNKEYVSLSEIAERQNISVKYLEKIVSLLSKSGLLTSMMGSLGGYRLSKRPEEISVGDILLSTGDMPELAPCMADGKCESSGTCMAIGVWENLSKLIYEFLTNLSLKDIVDKKL